MCCVWGVRCLYCERDMFKDDMGVEMWNGKG